MPRAMSSLPLLRPFSLTGVQLDRAPIDATAPVAAGGDSAASGARLVAGNRGGEPEPDGRPSVCRPSPAGADLRTSYVARQPPQAPGSFCLPEGLVAEPNCQPAPVDPTASESA